MTFLLLGVRSLQFSRACKKAYPNGVQAIRRDLVHRGGERCFRTLLVSYCWSRASLPVPPWPPRTIHGSTRAAIATRRVSGVAARTTASLQLRSPAPAGAWSYI